MRRLARIVKDGEPEKVTIQDFEGYEQEGFLNIGPGGAVFFTAEKPPLPDEIPSRESDAPSADRRGKKISVAESSDD